MKRYFYTDPLAASWMAKYFGMKYEPESEAHALVRLTDALQLSYQCKISLRPDTLPLLQPQVGDVVNTPSSMHRFKEVLIVELRDYLRQAGGYSIIQRNGIPFHWPQSEEGMEA